MLNKYLLIGILGCLGVIGVFWIIWRQLHKNFATSISQQLQNLLTTLMHEQQKEANDRELYTLKTLTETLNHTLHEARTEITSSLTQQTFSLNNAAEKLSSTTDAKLCNMAKVLDQKISFSLEKSHETLNNLLIRLTVIDQAQQKISALSQNV